MIYPSGPTGNGITLTEKRTKKLNEELNDRLDTYLRFKCIIARIDEISHGFVTLEVTYPDGLPESERDLKYILMVMAFVLGRPILDHIYNILLVEFEYESRPGYFEFDYYTQEEKNQLVEEGIFSTVGRRKIRDSILDRNYLINLYK